MPVKSRKRKKPNWNRRGWEGTRNSEAEIKELKLWAGKQYEFELNNMNIVIEHFFKLSTLSILVLNICCISPPKCSDYRITNFLFFFFFLPSFFFSAIFIFMIISGSQPYLTATLTALWNQVHYHLCKTNDRTGDSGHHWQSCLLASISHAGSWQWEEGVYQEMDSCKWLQEGSTMKASRIADACTANWPSGWVGFSGRKADPTPGQHRARACYCKLKEGSTLCCGEVDMRVWEVLEQCK